MSLHLDRTLALSWPASEIHGWGLVGVHTCLYLMDEGYAPALLCRPILESMRPQVRERFLQLQPLTDSIAALLPQPPHRIVLSDTDVLHSLGPDLAPTVEDQPVRGVRNIGVVPGEHADLGPEAIARANTYDKIVVLSTYMLRLLQARGVRRVGLAIQGVDPSDVGPGSRRGAHPGRFVIYSGGKLEYRKGQDIVVAAFRIFHARHPDALLVATWGNLWPAIALGMAESVHTPVPPNLSNGAVDIEGWLVANGISREGFVHPGMRPREEIAETLRDCDLAIFPNRCEAGTNLVAMEAMACGLPVVLSANTGHMDLIADDRCYVLRDQAPIPNHDGRRWEWGETSVEELVAVMEHAYQNREEAAAKGRAASEFILTQLTWRQFAERFVAECTTIP
jgi:glycosyltransferase involved in cell wall biosynthesis